MMRNLKFPYDRMHFRFGIYTFNKHAEIPRLEDEGHAEETVVTTLVGVSHVPALKIAKGS